MWWPSFRSFSIKFYTSDAVMVLATVPRAEDVSEILRQPGRLDCNITLPSPGAHERFCLLRSAFTSRDVAFAEGHLQAGP